MSKLLTTRENDIVIAALENLEDTLRDTLADHGETLNPTGRVQCEEDLKDTRQLIKEIRDEQRLLSAFAK